MVTRIRSKRPPHLYLAEWREHLGLSVQDVANRVEKARETVWRWENEQHRLDPLKIGDYAQALGIEIPQLYYPPHRPSIDAAMAGKSDEDVQRVMRMVIGIFVAE